MRNWYQTSETAAVICREDRDAAVVVYDQMCGGAGMHIEPEQWDRLRKSPDATVRYAIDILSSTFEDVLDVSEMEKSEWDYLQRVRLVLMSDAELHRQRQFLWSWADCLWPALACAAVAVLLWKGMGWYCLSALSLSGPFWMWIAYRGRQWQRAKGAYWTIIQPFTSIRQLAVVYEQTPAFQKKRFPVRRRGLLDRIRALGSWASTILTMGLFWPLLIPSVFWSGWEVEYDVVPTESARSPQNA